jgi:hypothetical protein
MGHVRVETLGDRVGGQGHDWDFAGLAREKRCAGTNDINDVRCAADDLGRQCRRTGRGLFGPVTADHKVFSLDVAEPSKLVEQHTVITIVAALAHQP